MFRDIYNLSKAMGDLRGGDMTMPSHLPPSIIKFESDQVGMSLLSQYLLLR